MSERKRIAVVIPTLHPAGAERVALTLAASLATAAEVDLITYSNSHPGGQPVVDWSAAVPDGVGYVHLNSDGSMKHLKRLVALRRLIQHRQYSGVLSVLSYSNLLVAIARRGTRFQHVASEHNLRRPRRNLDWRHALQDHMLRVAYKRSTKVAAVSHAVADDVRRRGAVRRAQHISVIYNPVDYARLTELERAATSSHEVNLDTGLLAIGRLHAQKGQDRLIKALPLCLEPVRVTLLGSGPSDAALRDLANLLNVGERVIFAGWRDNPVPYMLGARGIVFMSRWEGFGLVAAESAALNLPMIAADVPGLDEVCDISGYSTVDATDAEKVALALDRLWRAPEQFKPSGERFAFSVERAAGSYASLLEL